MLFGRPGNRVLGLFLCCFSVDSNIKLDVVMRVCLKVLCAPEEATSAATPLCVKS